MPGKDEFSPVFFSAAADYVYFLERGYADKPLLKLIGDRFGLSRRQRHILFRGFSTGRDSLRRRSRLLKSIKGLQVHLDAYNVILTVMNHFLGNPLFICTDGLLRDVGENHGHIRDSRRFQRAMEQVCSWLAAQEPEAVLAVFDSPVSHSADHAGRFKACMDAHGLSGDTDLARSADYVLKRRSEGIIATSDSVIIDATATPIVDIPRGCLESTFNTSFPDLYRIQG